MHGRGPLNPIGGVHRHAVPAAREPLRRVRVGGGRPAPAPAPSLGRKLGRGVGRAPESPAPPGARFELVIATLGVLGMAALIGAVGFYALAAICAVNGALWARPGNDRPPTDPLPTESYDEREERFRRLVDDEQWVFWDDAAHRALGYGHLALTVGVVGLVASFLGPVIAALVGLGVGLLYRRYGRLSREAAESEGRAPSQADQGAQQSKDLAGPVTSRLAGCVTSESVGTLRWALADTMSRPPTPPGARSSCIARLSAAVRDGLRQRRRPAHRAPGRRGRRPSPPPRRPAAGRVAGGGIVRGIIAARPRDARDAPRRPRRPRRPETGRDAAGGRPGEAAGPPGSPGGRPHGSKVRWSTD